MTKRLNGFLVLLALALTAGGCAAGQAFRQAETQMRAGNLDEAVAAYRKAVQAAPDNANYKIAMSRALVAASRAHLEKAKDFESKDQLEAALGEYKQASEWRRRKSRSWIARSASASRRRDPGRRSWRCANGLARRPPSRCSTRGRA